MALVNTGHPRHHLVGVPKPQHIGCGVTDPAEAARAAGKGGGRGCSLILRARRCTSASAAALVHGPPMAVPSGHTLTRRGGQVS